MNLDFNPEIFLTTAGPGHIMAEHYPREVIYAQGDAADAVFYIKDGKVKITVMSQQGKEAVVAMLGTGEFFGEGCLTGQTHRLTSAITIDECTLARLEKGVVVQTLHEQPAFAERFITYLLTRNQRIELDLVDQLFNSSEKRLARLLLILANFGKDEKPETIVPKISQATLAEMVGTTRSRISFFMNKFRRLGLVDYNGHMTVNRSLLNVVLYD